MLSFLSSILLTSIASADINVTVYPKDSNNDQRVEASFDVAASTKTVFSVLKDYNNLPKFISSLSKSKILSSKMAPSGFNSDLAKWLVVEQEGVGHAFLFKKRIYVQLLVEEYGNTIFFKDILRKDFNLYRGSWIVFAQGNRSSISYLLVSDPKFSVPFSNHIAKKNITKLLEEVQAEILRRSK